MQLKEAFMISDAGTEQGGDIPDTLKLLNIKSVMCVPLMACERLHGVLYLDSITKPYGFRGEDLHLLNAMSNPVAMTIESGVSQLSERNSG